jgi:hypothetical protein
MKQGVGFLVTLTWYRFILRRHSAFVGRWDRYIIVSGDHTSLMCTVCYPCAIYTSKSEVLVISVFVILFFETLVHSEIKTILDFTCM